MTAVSRYSRQELFEGIGSAGQARIRRASAIVVGCGALGSTLAETLTRAGIGRLTLVDRDFVELSNLHRQTLFSEDDALEGRPKAIAAKRRLDAVNADVDVRALVTDLTASNAAQIVASHDVVLDGTDNFETRFVVNDVCVRTRTPWVYGACVGSHGLALAVLPGRTPCLRCVLQDIPPPGSLPTCDTAGVIAPIVQVIAGVQGAEALKILGGARDRLLSGLFMADVWSGDFGVTSLANTKPSCPACTEGRFEFEEASAAPAVTLCGRGAIQVRPGRPAEIDLEQLAKNLVSAGAVTRNEYLVRAVGVEVELAVFRDGRAIIKGARDEAQARSLYARYVGA